jgi:hypothetical protein
LGIRSFISGLFSRKVHVVQNIHVTNAATHEQVSNRLADLGLLPSNRITPPHELLSRVQPVNPWPRPANNPSPNLRAHLDTIYSVNTAAKVKEPVWVDDLPNDPIKEKFLKFHKENPKIYEKLIDLAFMAKASGYKRIGIKNLFEHLRWYYTVEVKGSEPYVLNNSYSALYARLIMANVPALNGFFEIRRRG